MLCNAFFDKLRQTQSESLKCGIFDVIDEYIRRLVFPLQVLVSFVTERGGDYATGHTRRAAVQFQIHQHVRTHILV